MSSSGGHHGDGAEDDIDEGVDTPRSSRPRADWEIQEVVATALLIAVALVAVGAVAAGIDANAEGSFQPARDAVAQALLQSTLWAGVTTMFLLVSALGLVWWQVDGWSEALEETGADDAEEARLHLRRNRLLATWAGVSLAVTSLAAIGTLVAIGLEDEPVSVSMRLEQWFSYGGGVIAALVLAAAGIFAVTRVLRLCDGALPSP
jgi:hypothetical protein